MLTEAPSLRTALVSFLVALVVVVMLVLVARFLAPTHHRPPHVARPAADAHQEDPIVSLNQLEAQMHDFFATLTAPTTPPPPAPTVTIPPPAPPVVDAPTPLDNPDGFLACVRQRESGGDYTIHELTGASQAAGAYQFLPSTWNAIAASVGRTDLVGIDPAAASPADQDAMAEALYAQQGAAPWGGSC